MIVHIMYMYAHAHTFTHECASAKPNSLTVRMALVTIENVGLYKYLYSDVNDHRILPFLA